MRDVIVATKLSKAYDRKRVVHALDLRIKEGEFFGFLGPNGAGKTTTIRMLTGILQPTEGTVTIDGHRLPEERKEAARSLGAVPESRGFYEWMTAEEYLAFFAELYGVGEARIDELLAATGLADRKRTPISTFSFGMRQRLGIARALLNEPRVLFLDEPTIGLDPKGQEDVQLLLRKLNREGVTIFLSSHLLNEVSSLCTRIGIIDKGRLVAEGTLGELRTKSGAKDGSLTDIFLRLTGGRP